MTIATSQSQVTIRSSMQASNQDYCTIPPATIQSRNTTFKNSISLMKMIGEETALVLLSSLSEKCLVAVNLKKQIQTKIPLNFMNFNNFMGKQTNIEIFNFQESNMFCIKQCRLRTNITSQLQKIKLDYFNNRQPYQHILEFTYDQSQSDQKDLFSRFAHQGNYHSLLIFIKEKQPTYRGRLAETSFSIMLHEVNLEGGQATSRVRTVQIPGISNYLNSIWQLQDNILLCFFENKDNQDEEIAICLDIKDKVVREFEYKIKSELRSVYFMKGFVCIEEETLKATIEGNKRNYVQQQSLSFICHEEQAVSLIREQPDEQLNFKSVCDYDPSILIEKFFDEVRSSLVVRKLRPVRRKQFYIQALLYLNEDFDDDLLLDCMNLLT